LIKGAHEQKGTVERETGPYRVTNNRDSGGHRAVAKPPDQEKQSKEAGSVLGQATSRQGGGETER